MSLGGDGKPCPPPGKPPQNCSMMMHSDDGGRSFQPITNGWSSHSFNEIIPLHDSNNSFYSLGYGTKFTDTALNTTATQLGWRGRLLSNGSVAVDEKFEIEYSVVDTSPTQTSSSSSSSSGTRKWGGVNKFPPVLVHSGSVVPVGNGSAYLTTLYVFRHTTLVESSEV